MERIHQYQVLRTLGEGGYGVVYLCEDPGLDRPVAIKVLKRGSESGRDRFRREAKVLGRLVHPNIVAVHGYGELDDCPYLVLEYLDGQTLQQRLDTNGPLPIREAVELIAGAADAIAYCHEQNVLHRDLKPENIMVAGGVAKLTDFGLCKVEASGQSGLTAPGQGLGTLGYLPPEQLENALSVSPAADLFALGGCLYSLLAGWKPFPGRTLREVIMRTLEGKPTPIRQLRAEVPAILDAICLRCLQRYPEDRYPSAARLRDDLRSFLRGESVELPASEALTGPHDIPTPGAHDVLEGLMDDSKLEPPEQGTGELRAIYAEHAERGMQRARAKDFKAAVLEFTAALAVRPDDPETRLHLALAKRKTLDSMGAIEDYSRVLEASPNEPRAYVGRAAARTDVKNFAGAVNDFERALQIYPHDHPRAKRIRRALESARSRLGDTVLRPGTRLF